MKNKLLGYYSFFLGVCIIGMWSMILMKGAIPEGRTEMSFHLVSEFLMAVLCVISGVMLLFNHPLARKINITALSMIIYSVINAAGYYGERGETSMVVLFLLLMILTVIALSDHLFLSQPRQGGRSL